MKIRIDAKLLTDLVSTASQAISSRPANQTNECVYLVAKNGEDTAQLSVLGQDSGISVMKCTRDVTVEEDGEAMIPAKTLLSFVSIMNGELTLSVDGNFKCSIKCGSKKSNIAGIDPDHFSPSLPKPKEKHEASMSGEHFSKLVSSVIHCVDERNGRQVLTGVRFSFLNETGICEATGCDGFRLAICKKHAECSEDFSATIPLNISKLIAKVMLDKEKIGFVFGDGIVVAESFDTEICAALLADGYPNVEKMMIHEGKLQFVANAEDLLDAVKMCNIAFGEIQKSLVVLDFSTPCTVRVSANSDFIQSTADVDCGVVGALDGGNGQIAFSGEFLLEAIKAGMKYSGEVTMMINNCTSAAAILPTGTDEYYQLVLPVRRIK